MPHRLLKTFLKAKTFLTPELFQSKGKYNERKTEMARDFGRPINRIVLHCTATSLEATPEAINTFWFTPKKNAQTGATKPYIPNVQGGAGWKNAGGYHYLIDSQGKRHILSHLSKTTNGVRGYNWDSCHIATIGGREYDDRTRAQKDELVRLINELRSDSILGNIPVIGHRDLSPDKDGNGIITPDEFLKLCPNYDTSEWLQSVGITP